MVLLVKDIDWEELKRQISKENSFVDEYGVEYKESILGELASLTPSGKYRDFGRPARNLEALGSYKGYIRTTELQFRPPNKDEQQDSDWWAELCHEAKKYGLYIRPSDQDRKIIGIGMKIRDR